jgi:hypothetical protein
MNKNQDGEKINDETLNSQGRHKNDRELERDVCASG